MQKLPGYITENNAFLVRLKYNRRFSKEDISNLTNLCGRPRHVPRSRNLLPDSRNQTVILLQGYCSSYRTLASGKQVIFDFKVPGDVACMRNIIIGRSRQNLVTATDAVVCFVPTKSIRDMLEKSPAIREAFIDKLDEEEGNLADRFAQIARSSALERTAAFLLNMLERLDVVGLASNRSFPCPVTQDEMADALGVTPVHISRTLRQLRDASVATMSAGRVVIHDLAALRSLVP